MTEHLSTHTHMCIGAGGCRLESSRPGCDSTELPAATPGPEFSFSLSLTPFSSLYPSLTLVRRLGTVQSDLGHSFRSMCPAFRFPLAPWMLN